MSDLLLLLCTMMSMGDLCTMQYEKDRRWKKGYALSLGYAYYTSVSHTS